MVYKATNKTYDFRKFKTIRAFGNKIRNNVINEDMANTEQSDLLNCIEKFNSRTKLRDPELKKLKKEVTDSAIALLQGRKMVFTTFKSGIFPRFEESQEGTRLKI